MNLKPIHKYQTRKSRFTMRFFRKLSFWLLLILPLLALLFAAGKPVANPTTIVLRNEPLPFTPKEFYIADVVDARINRKAVAYLVPMSANPQQVAKAVPVDLQGGGHTAIKQYMRESLRRNTALRPVVVRLKEAKVTETPVNGRVEGQIAINMAFELRRDGETVPLVEYKGGAKYIRSANQVSIVEPALRKSLGNALLYLNTWMNQEADRNEKLAKGIKVTFTDYVSSLEDDSVFYTSKRPLTWADFKGAPSKPSQYAAAVMPGFAYEGRSEVSNGIVHLNLLMKVFMLQSSSWVKEHARDEYSLNHEQRHFEIAKLVAERFKKRITPDSLTVADYNSIIQYKYIESFREMNHLQEQYDTETRHGLDQLAQERWNKRIDEELKAFKVKK